MRKPLELSADLVAGIHREVPDPGLDPERIAMTDDDYQAAADEILAALGSQPLLVFGYGSLLWRPGFDYASRWPDRCFGWHRSFCMMSFRRQTRSFRLISVRDHEGAKRALTFYADMRFDRAYVKLSIQEQANMLARAAGHGGTGAAYLQQTVARLKEVGIHDEYLWRLQKLVAAEIRGLAETTAPTPMESPRRAATESITHS